MAEGTYSLSSLPIMLDNFDIPTINEGNATLVNLANPSHTALKQQHSGKNVLFHKYNWPAFQVTIAYPGGSEIMGALHRAILDYNEEHKRSGQGYKKIKFTWILKNQSSIIKCDDATWDTPNLDGMTPWDFESSYVELRLMLPNTEIKKWVG